MRILMFSAAMIASVVWIGIPANAALPSMSGIGNTSIKVGTLKNVGYWRRYYRRYGYPVPYGYPPAYDYYVPPAAYAYPPATSYASPTGGDYDDGTPPEDEYGDATPPEGNYNNESNSSDGSVPPEGDHAGGPPPEGY